MTKPQKRKGWIIVTIFAIIITSGIFFLPAKLVNPIDYEHTTIVLWRVRKEIVQKSPAGRYYEALIRRHSKELDAILTEEKMKEIVQTTKMFLPGLEALLDGKGNTVRITKKQTNSLKTELDWMTSVGSPALREDIEKEQQRFPLDHFVGMTMSEAWDYINSNFPADLTAESITPTTTIAAPQPTSTPICITGPTSDCLAEPLLVNNSNGERSYYVYNDIYFEFPNTWSIKQNGRGEELLLFPAQESPEGMRLRLIHLMFLPNTVIENWDRMLTDQFYEGWKNLWARPNTRWKRLVKLTDFQGFECLWISPDAPGPYLEFFLYNESRQTAVGFLAQIEDDKVVALLDNPDAVNEVFPNIQNIIKSIRTWKPYDLVDVYAHGSKLFP